MDGEIFETSEFPVSMTQISTVGLRHNQSPYMDKKETIPIGDELGESSDIMRVYFDGLVMHVHVPPLPSSVVSSNNPLFLGSAKNVLVPAVTYEASFQYENMLHLMRECFGSYLPP